MKRLLAILGLGIVANLHAADELPKPQVVAKGLASPSAVAVGTDGKVYIATQGSPAATGDGQILVLENGKAVPFASGLDNPQALVAVRDQLYVADKKLVWRVDRKGKTDIHVPAAAFPESPKGLRAIDADELGQLYLLDADEQSSAIYRIGPKSKKVEVITSAETTPGLGQARGLVLDGMSFLVLSDAAGKLQQLKLADKSLQPRADAGGGPIAWDKFGRLFVGNAKSGTIAVIPRPGEKPVILATGFQGLGNFCVEPTGRNLLVPDAKAGTVSAIPIEIPGWAIDVRPLELESAAAFPNLKWAGWQAVDDNGRPNPLRPIVLTHAGDGSNRVFVATQHGVIHVFPNDQKATESRIFLDIQRRVTYNDKQNEEGFLGLAFHPKYKTNGEFFAFYTVKQPALTNVLSRFRVSKDDPNKADPDFEEELLRIKTPFWNHDGGTVCFGPDGFLYVTLGDGGLANDPFKHGQDLTKLFGKVLRIDVDRKDEGKPYAIPKDNPFVGRDGARGEIWAYGLRNIWRMAFDRQTGVLWAGEVGQNLYEEIIIIRRGGNYGWSIRESLHPFGASGVGPSPDLIDPIWEYHHDVGKSITGGSVYRGPRLPELSGHYLYADYVTAKHWALKYDDQAKRVVANRSIKDQSLPVLSFGEDEKGEVYYLTHTNSGRGIYWYVRPGAAKP